MSYQPVQEDELEDELEAVSSVPEPNPAAYVRVLASGTPAVAHSDLTLSPSAFQNEIWIDILEKYCNWYRIDECVSMISPKRVRSIYTLTPREAAKGIASRIVYSQYYIFLYLVLAALSTTTVVLSLAEGCPGLAFYILEIIVNSAMIAEVSIRYIAFGKQFWKSPFNVVDLGLTCLCVITILVIFFSGCGKFSKEEELLDTFLLVARNVLQFGRLATVMRRSGRSIFSRPKPIDLNAPRANRLDIDLSDEEADIGFGPPSVEFDVDWESAPRIRAPAPPRNAPNPSQPVHNDIWTRGG